MSSLSVPTALYQQVVAVISNDVRTGALRDGDRISSERDLAERFGVSRVTVRRALAELTASGVIESHPGRGTFVTSRVVGEAPNALMSFSDLGAERGLTATAKVLSRTHRPSTLDEATTFDLAPGASLFVLERVRLLDGLPVSIDSSVVPAARVPDVDQVDFRTASLYRVLDDSGAAPVRADYAVRAVAATKVHVRHLQVPLGSPLLQTSTTSVDAGGAVVEVGVMVYRGDRYQFRATLVRRP